MSCGCNTKNNLEFIDIEGLRYLVAVLDRVVDTRDKHILKTAKHYINAVAKDVLEEAKRYTDEEIDNIDFLSADAISLDGNVLKIKLKDGSFKEIDLSVLGGGGGNLNFATIADIDAMF